MDTKRNKNSLHTAAVAHYDAKIKEAKAHLEIYFSNSVGIGEHSNLLEEVKKWTTSLAEAQECYDILLANFDS